MMFRRELSTQLGKWTETLFRYADEDIVVLSVGNWLEADAPLIRIHSTCFAAHYLGSIECDCREQLEITMELISDAGAGAILFLDQDGRANGHLALMRAAVYAAENSCSQADAYRTLGYSPDSRSFAGAAAILKSLGATTVTLATNNPEKIRALTDVGINVNRRRVVAPESANPRLTDYYRLKATEGHHVEPEHIDGI
ncbi:GTP cyclohydrolase II [Lentzea californiensis]|nr:GTP cyclohydrolase II [Lentzea californiensis]